MCCGQCFYFGEDDDPGSYDTCVNEDSEYYGIPIISDDMCNLFKNKDKEDIWQSNPLSEVENDLDF